MLGLAVTWIAAPTPEAHAGGLEFPAAGTRALGRGGAFLARPDTPMALLYNPANLASTPGIQLSLQSHLTFYSACFDRAGTYEQYDGQPENDHRSDFTWGATGTPGAFGVDIPAGDLPEVCNSGPPGPVPELIFTWRVHRKVGIGIGLLAPAAVGHTVWGEDFEHPTNGRTYRGTVNGLPAPTRYGLIEEQLIIAFPTIGFGAQVAPWARIGASFGWGFGIFSFENITRATRGEDFSGDVHTQLDAVDPFIPRVTASAQFTPHDNLDIALSFTWTDTVRADADLVLQSGYYRDEVLDTLDLSRDQLPDGVDPGVLEAPQPWQIGFGIRYADRIRPRLDDPDAESALSGQVEDSMSNERWDLEFNFIYEANSRVDQFGVTLPVNPATDNGSWSIEADQGLTASLPPDLAIPHNWRDSYSMRLGGDFNIIPGTFSIRAGVSFEGKGVTDGYEQLDFFPLMRLGGGLGATLRFGRFDLSLSYAFIQQFATTVTNEDGAVRQINAAERFGQLACEAEEGCDPDNIEQVDERTDFGQSTIINIGRYTSRFNVVSLGLTYHFR